MCFDMAEDGLVVMMVGITKIFSWVLIIYTGIYHLCVVWIIIDYTFLISRIKQGDMAMNMMLE